MKGRKLEEGDWSEVYCDAKGIPRSGWSNLDIDLIFNGLGVEFKMLRISGLRGKSIKDVCGQTKMHPSATRSIRIEDTAAPPNEVMVSVLRQYGMLIEEWTAGVCNSSPDGTADMRNGWLLWEETLKEFLYFEEAMTKPNPDAYVAHWKETPAHGRRKGSRSLWIYSQADGKKKFSVTTSAGIKIQPYFSVPEEDDSNLAYFRVQSELVDDNTVALWITGQTAARLVKVVGSVRKEVVSNAIVEAGKQVDKDKRTSSKEDGVAVRVRVSRDAFDVLREKWDGVNDEERVERLVCTLEMEEKIE